MDINSIDITGRIAVDPVLKELKSKEEGKDLQKTWFKLASSQDGKTSFFQVVCWNGVAKALKKYAGKGRQIAIHGHLKQSNYEKDGHIVKNTYIVAEKILYLAKPKNKDK